MESYEEPPECHFERDIATKGACSWLGQGSVGAFCQKYSTAVFKILCTS